MKIHLRMYDFMGWGNPVKTYILCDKTKKGFLRNNSEFPHKVTCKNCLKLIKKEKE